LIFQGIFRGLSKDYSEAAIVDGASDFTIMVKINFPMIFNSIIIVAVLNFIAFWNDYQTPMVYLRSHPTVSYGLYYFNNINDSKFGMLIYKVAGFMLMMIPTLLLFLGFKDKMIGNLTIGGLKG
jgi:ABC-type glycerol-3-phosphate transport system permease component